MIARAELRNIASERLKDAEALLSAARYDGAIYLGGYVVELALKNRICVVLNWKDSLRLAESFRTTRVLKPTISMFCFRFLALRTKSNPSIWRNGRRCRLGPRSEV